MIDNKFRILLVEDDEVDIKNVKRAFKKININNPLQVARDGVEALQILRETAATSPTTLPKIVMLDINMPRMNGLECLREIRSDPDLTSLAVFVLTTSNNDQDKRAAQELNVAGYIIKPVEWSDFVEAISTLNKYWSINDIA